MKRLLSHLFIHLFFIGTSLSQICQVTVSASQTAVCVGQQVTVNANAFASLPANQFFDFNQNALPQGWSVTGGSNFTSPCGPSPTGTPYYWASTAGNGVPQIVTADFDICSGGYIEFRMRYAVQGGAAPCEGPDLAHEGVSLQYSLNGGGTWQNIIYYSPGGFTLPANPGTTGSVATGATAYTVWNTFNVPIPPAAISTSTRFRWVQANSSGTCCDNWGLDDIGIYAGPCLAADLVWSNGLAGVDNFTFTATADTCFTANLYDDNNNFLCSDDICITVSQPFYGTQNVLICDGETYFFGPQSAILPYTSSGSYPVSFPSVSSCDSIVTLNLSVIPMYNENLDVTICSGEIYSFAGQDYSVAGSYPVLFQSIAGCDSTVTLNLNVNPVYQESVSGEICQGQTFLFAGQSFTQGGTYPLAFQTIEGCDSIITLTLNVVPIPQPSAGNDVVLCSGEVAQLGGAGLYSTSYSWSPPLGLSDPNISDPSISIQTNVLVNQSYVVTSFYDGCTSTDTVNVQVIPYPVPGAPQVQGQCFEGNSFSFSPGNNFLPGATFNWTFANGLPAQLNQQSPAGISFSQPGVHTVDLTISNGNCSASQSFDVQVFAQPVAAFSAAPQSGCVPLSVTFSNLSVPADVTSSWTFGNGQSSSQTNPSANFSQAGSYSVTLTVTTSQGCSNTLSLPNYITAHPMPVAGFGASPWSVYEDEPVINITDASTGALSWNYTISSGGFFTTPDFTYSFYDTGYHFIQQIVTTAFGCTDQITQAVQVLPATTLFIPNAFTPNNDGINTFFRVVGNTVRDFNLKIYDRWGIKVFESNDIDEGWDGKMRNGNLLKQDVYVYKITYVDHRGNEQLRHGHILLIR